MANSEDPDQTAPSSLIWVCTVCLSVPKPRIFYSTFFIFLMVRGIIDILPRVQILKPRMGPTKGLYDFFYRPLKAQVGLVRAYMAVSKGTQTGPAHLSTGPKL